MEEIDANPQSDSVVDAQLASDVDALDSELPSFPGSANGDGVAVTTSSVEVIPQEGVESVEYASVKSDFVDNDNDSDVEERIPISAGMGVSSTIVALLLYLLLIPILIVLCLLLFFIFAPARIQRQVGWTSSDGSEFDLTLYA
jgi:hypothetical protein